MRAIYLPLPASLTRPHLKGNAIRASFRFSVGPRRRTWVVHPVLGCMAHTFTATLSSGVTHSARFFNRVACDRRHADRRTITITATATTAITPFESALFPLAAATNTNTCLLYTSPSPRD